MFPAGNSGSGKPGTSKSFGGQLRDWFFQLSPFRSKQAPHAAPSPQSAFKRSRDEAFSIALPPTSEELPPSSQAPHHAASNIDQDDPTKAKRPNLGQRVAQLKEMHSRQPMEPEPSKTRTNQPGAGAAQEGVRSHSSFGPIMLQGFGLVPAASMQPQLPGPGHANVRESSLEPKALPFESPRQQQPQPQAAQQQQQQWQQRGAMPAQTRQLPDSKSWGILQTPYSTPSAHHYGPSSSRPTPFNYQHPMYSRPMPSPMQPSMQPFRPPEGRPSTIMRSALNRQSGRVSDPGFSLYQQLIRDFKPQPLPQAAQFLGMIDLSKSDEDFEKAALIGQRRKEREDERRLNTVQVLAQLQLVGSQSIQEARARSDVLEQNVAALTMEKRVAARASAARRRQEEEEHVRLIQETRRREEAERAAAAAAAVAAAAAAREEAERQRERQKQLAADAGDKKKKKKKQQKKQEEAIVIESSEDEGAAPAAKGRQAAAASSPGAVATKRGSEPRRLQKGFSVTPEESASWRLVFDQGAPNEQLINYRNMEISREKLLCMNVRQWLNDEAINLYLLLLQERDTAMRSQPPRSGAAPRCHFHNSFFLSKLYRDKGRYEYKQVQRWTTAKRLQGAGQASPNLLDVDRIIMPVNCNNLHWTCCMIDLQQQQFVYYDSMMGQDAELLENLAQYLRDEAKDKCNGRVLDTSSWKRVFNPEPLPRQKNGCDCGVFTIMFADRLGLGQPFDFSQADMDDIRIKVLHCLLSNKI